MTPEEFKNLSETVAAKMDGQKAECPHCKKEFNLLLTPKLADKNKMTMVLHMEEGHMLQASTLGSTMMNLSKMLHATAKHLGGKIEVFVSDVRFEGSKISIDFLAATVIDKRAAGSAR